MLSARKGCTQGRLPGGGVGKPGLEGGGLSLPTSPAPKERFGETREHFGAGSEKDPKTQSWWFPPCQAAQSKCRLSSTQCRAGWRLGEWGRLSCQSLHSPEPRASRRRGTGTNHDKSVLKGLILRHWYSVLCLRADTTILITLRTHKLSHRPGTRLAGGRLRKCPTPGRGRAGQLRPASLSPPHLPRQGQLQAEEPLGRSHRKWCLQREVTYGTSQVWPP